MLYIMSRALPTSNNDVIALLREIAHLNYVTRDNPEYELCLHFFGGMSMTAPNI